MKYKIYNNVFLGLSSFIIAVIYLLLALNTFFKFDDYCFRVQMENQNSLLILWDHYIKHDGRALSPIYLFRNLCVKYLSPELNGLLSTLSLIGISYFFTKLIYGLTNQSPKNNTYIIFNTLLLSACLWMGIRANLSRIIYWPIGSYYIYITCICRVNILYDKSNQ